MLRHRKLGEAVKALERAKDAAYEAVQFPHTVRGCETQMKAAEAELACALQLIKEARKS